jgi:hypothetical protein
VKTGMKRSLDGQRVPFQELWRERRSSGIVAGGEVMAQNRNCYDTAKTSPLFKDDLTNVGPSCIWLSSNAVPKSSPLYANSKTFLLPTERSENPSLLTAFAAETP